MEYLISDFSELKIAGDCSQKAGNAILETLDIKISQGGHATGPPEKLAPSALVLCPPNIFNPATALSIDSISSQNAQVNTPLAPDCDHVPWPHYSC